MIVFWVEQFLETFIGVDFGVKGHKMIQKWHNCTGDGSNICDCKAKIEL